VDLLRKVIDFYIALLSPVQLAILVVAGITMVCMAVFVARKTA